MENKDAARRLYVPLCQSEEIPDADLAIDPYVMGCLLGDGNYSATAVSITKPYQQLFDNIQSRLPDHLECSWYEHSGNPPKTFGIRFKEGYEKSNPDLKPCRNICVFWTYGNALLGKDHPGRIPPRFYQTTIRTATGTNGYRWDLFSHRRTCQI